MTPRPHYRVASLGHIGSTAEHGPISALERHILVVVQDRDFVFHGSTQMSLLLGPLIGEYHRRPAIPTPLLAQATQGREKLHMRRRDQNILARELSQQLMP